MPSAAATVGSVGADPAAGTDIISPQPPCSPKQHGSSARSLADVRSRSISRTDSADNRPLSAPALPPAGLPPPPGLSLPAPSAASIATNAHRSSMVDTSQPAPSGSAGGVAYQPS